MTQYTYDPTTSARAKGLTAATADYNAVEKSRHEANEWMLPPEQRTVYVDITEEQFFKLRVDEVLESYARSFGVSIITSSDFVLRFTPTENAAITASTDPNVQGLIALLKSHATVDLQAADTVNGVAYLQATGYLTPERAAVILAA
jgi:hypothetical protein